MMFSREIESRQRKFEKDALSRKRQERLKQEKLNRDRDAARKRQEEVEERTRERKLLAEQQRLQEEERQEELRERNRGVLLEQTLSPGPLSEETAQSYGIKRWKDKVVLPSSMSEAVMQQEAYRNGALLFELTAENGNRTHVGVLNFSGAEGTILVPPHVRRCLWGPEGLCQAPVRVSYKRLVDGHFARLQPLKQGFHEAVGENMREVLESALSKYSVLTEGDILDIPLFDSEMVHHLKVVELEPARAVRILHTDLEVDVLPSAEVEDELKSRMQSLEKPTFRTSNRLQKYRIAKQATPEPTPPQEDPSEATLDWKDLEESTPEPAEGEEDVITCMIRFPNGASVSRRFQLDDALSTLFTFLHHSEAGMSLGGKFALVTQFPRQVFSVADGEKSFRECALEKHQLFFVETQ